MASVYVSKRQADPAVPLLERALQVSPRSGEAHYLLGLSSLLRNDLARAERELVAATQNGVENARVYQELGLVYAEGGKYAEAIRAWERSLRYDPQNVEVRRSIETARGMLP